MGGGAWTPLRVLVIMPFGLPWPFTATVWLRDVFMRNYPTTGALALPLCGLPAPVVCRTPTGRLGLSTQATCDMGGIASVLGPAAPSVSGGSALTAFQAIRGRIYDSMNVWRSCGNNIRVSSIGRDGPIRSLLAGSQWPQTKLNSWLREGRNISLDTVRALQNRTNSRCAAGSHSRRRASILTTWTNGQTSLFKVRLPADHPGRALHFDFAGAACHVRISSFRPTIIRAIARERCHRRPGSRSGPCPAGLFATDQLQLSAGAL